jgi:hypothetical protein
MSNLFNKGRTPNAGEKITAKCLDDVARGINSARPQFGGAVNGIRTAGGSTLFVGRQRSAASNVHPYQCFPGYMEGLGAVIYIEYGSHNNKVPVLGVTEELDLDRSKNYFEIYDNEKVVFFKLKVDPGNGLIREIIIDAAAELPQDETSIDSLEDDLVFHQLLCSVVFSEKEPDRLEIVRQNVTGSQWFLTCGFLPAFGVI